MLFKWLNKVSIAALISLVQFQETCSYMPTTMEFIMVEMTPLLVDAEKGSSFQINVFLYPASKANLASSSSSPASATHFLVWSGWNESKRQSWAICAFANVLDFHTLPSSSFSRVCEETTCWQSSTCVWRQMLALNFSAKDINSWNRSQKIATGKNALATMWLQKGPLVLSVSRIQSIASNKEQKVMLLTSMKKVEELGAFCHNLFKASYGWNFNSAVLFPQSLVLNARWNFFCW